MLSLVLTVTLAQAADVRAPVGVVLTSRRPGAEAASVKIAGRVFDVLKKEGVGGLLNNAQTTRELKEGGFSDPRTCQGTRSCLSKLAILLGAKAVVIGVDVGKVGKTLAIHLDAIAADQEKPLASLDVSSSFDGWSDAMSAPIVVFVRDVKAGLEIQRDEPPPPPPVVVAPKVDDTPKRTDLTPAPKEEPLVVAKPSSGGLPRAVPWALAGTAVAAAGGSVVLGILGAGDKAKFNASLVSLPDGTQGSTLPESEAKALASSANTKIGLAIGTAVLSAALGGAAAYFFIQD
ncbi:MAG: hypothetical protein AB1730_07940 [Myxococcota bacterium]|jgi:hypothetical protein